MSHIEVSRFVTLALEDENLREQLERSPDQAFHGYELTDEEKQAIAAADEHRLRHLGLDPMTAHSWGAFHNVEHFAPDMPNAPGDLPKGAP
jgi:hypothetical protein